MTKNYIKPIEMQVFLFGDLTAGFKVVNTDGFEGPLSFLRVVNTMDESVIISFDGVYGHDYVLAGDEIEVSAQIFSMGLNNKSLFKKYTKVYVKQGSGAPKSGALIVSGYYQD